MGKIFTKAISWLLLLGFLILSASMFTGCKSVKKLFEKKKESVSVLEKKDVQFDQKIEADLDIVHLDKSKSYSFVPLDPEKTSTVIHGTDTLNFTNARIEVNKKDLVTTTKDNSVVNTRKKDQTETEIEKKTKEVKRDTEKTGTSPALIWGGLLLLLILIIIWYLRKQITFF